MPICSSRLLVCIPGQGLEKERYMVAPFSNSFYHPFPYVKIGPEPQRLTLMSFLQVAFLSKPKSPHLWIPWVQCSYLYGGIYILWIILIYICHNAPVRLLITVRVHIILNSLPIDNKKSIVQRELEILEIKFWLFNDS